MEERCKELEARLSRTVWNTCLIVQTYQDLYICLGLGWSRFFVHVSCTAELMNRTSNQFCFEGDWLVVTT